MLERLRDSYQKFFSLSEFLPSENARILFFIALAYQMFLFATFVGDDAGTVQAYQSNVYTCWPFFQQCGEWYFLNLKQYGYSQTALYGFLFILQTVALFAAIRGRWLAAHGIFLLTWLWEAFFLLVLSYEAGEAYSYLHLLLSAVLLFAACKEWTARALVVFLYVLGGVTEFYRAYILDGLPKDMPLIPAGVELWFVHGAFALQWIGVWYLLSKDARYRRGVLSVFVAFHVYAGVVFEQYYMLLIVPILPALFWFDVPAKKPSGTYIWRMAIICLGLLMMHAWIIFALHSRSFTFARPHLGIATYFPATSGVSLATVRYEDGTEKVIKGAWQNRPCRCSPYTRWFELKALCRGEPPIREIFWSLDLSFAHEPLHRVIETANVCALDFSIFQTNDWIQK
ncbi:MAG: hypothetical protein G01um10148_721 [Parcubacteria group bacterium Gr01-1014_8]|nr:MAG: hypothetical protein G01um10148_721 [Parcubacteria group bacterium Gr01-1014_8]